MDLVYLARRIRRTRISCRGRKVTPMRLEALEERTLLSLTPLPVINPVALYPAEITGAAGNVYFVTKGADGGSDLDMKTATGVALIKEFPALSGFTNAVEEPFDLTAAGSKLFFFADAGPDQQLWVTNGTRAGTNLVKNVSGGVMDAAAVGSELFFTTMFADKGAKNLLYKSNGTTAGTVPVTIPAVSSKFDNIISANNLVSYRGAVYFSFGGELMKTTGTTTKVVDTFAPPKSNPINTGWVENLTVAGGVLYFTFPDGSQHGADLYATNGTAGGTTLLKDFTSASAYDDGEGIYLVSSLTAVGPKLFFGVDDAAHGPSFWVSDGTAAGTTFVKSFGATPNTAAGGNLTGAGPILISTVAGNRLFFTTEPGPGATGTEELWVSDGTSAGTTMLADIDPGSAGPYSSVSGNFAAPASGQLAALNGVLFFANDDPAHGVEVWQSDGTAAGTGLFLDINPGAAGSFPGNMAVINNTLYFSATAAAGSSAVWSSNGTAAGTTAVASFGSQPDGSALFGNITDAFAVLGNSMLFAADDGTETDLWKTDGTAAGTEIVKVLMPGTPTSAPSDFTTVGDKAFFAVTQGKTETLWVTDGTTGGTTEVATFDGTLTEATAFDGKLAFIESTTGATDSTLWVSDGTASGTTQVASFPNPGPNYDLLYPTTIAALDGKLYFTAPPPASADATGSFTLWVSDGTTAGTMPIAGAPLTASPSILAVYQGKFYFSADTPRAQLWVTNGTAAGTEKVANVGSDTETINNLVAAGPNLYIFTNDSGLYGSQVFVGLYKSNGTAKGTVPVHRFVNDVLNDSAGLPDGDLSLDVLTNAKNPYPQLWMSNGTVAGTKALESLGGGVGDGAITAINGRLFLDAHTAKYGFELWQSNGTVSGTTLLQDINPGKGNSYPYALTEVNGNLIVEADYGTGGLELLSGPVPAVPAAPAAVKARQPSR
jgi:ELWxxDGT repeat protein